MKMEPELKAKWVAALRSGEYLQGHGKFVQIGKRGNRAYCCLGLLEHLCGTTEDVLLHYNDKLCIRVGNDSEQKVERGVDFDTRTRLAEMNDGQMGQPKHSFAAIADYIEATL